MAEVIVSRRGKRGPVKYRNEVAREDGVVRLQLQDGLSAVVDEADYPLVADIHWTADGSGPLIYAIGMTYTEEGKRYKVMMHRMILGLKKGEKMQGDHRDGNGLNNRRENIRPATQAQNGRNKRKHRQCASRFRGVGFRRQGQLKKRWTAVAYLNHKAHHLGFFETEREAALAYNRAATELHGEFARLNQVE